MISHLNTPFPGAQLPDIVGMSDGRFVAVWSGGDGSDKQIHGRIFNSDDTAFGTHRLQAFKAKVSSSTAPTIGTKGIRP
jgi:hypothetical protein